MSNAAPINPHAGIRDQAGLTGKTMSIQLPAAAAGTVEKEHHFNAFFGRYYNIHFPFSASRLVNGSGGSLENMVVYAGLIVLMAALTVMAPFIAAAQLYEEWRYSEQGPSLFWSVLGIVPRTLAMELGLFLGFITVPALLLANFFNFFVLSFKELKS